MGGKVVQISFKFALLSKGGKSVIKLTEEPQEVVVEPEVEQEMQPQEPPKEAEGVAEVLQLKHQTLLIEPELLRKFPIYMPDRVGNRLQLLLQNILLWSLSLKLRPLLLPDMNRPSRSYHRCICPNMCNLGFPT